MLMQLTKYKEYINSLTRDIKEFTNAMDIIPENEEKIEKTIHKALRDVDKILDKVVNYHNPVGFILIEKIFIISISLVAETAPHDRIKKMFITNIINSLQEEINSLLKH
jgi:hypothetical protein